MAKDRHPYDGHLGAPLSLFLDKSLSPDVFTAHTDLLTQSVMGNIDFFPFCTGPLIHLTSPTGLVRPR